MNSELHYFFMQLFNGLAIGSIYALIAIGYSMVYSILYLMNFAHGDLFIFGAFIALALLKAGLPIPAIFLLSGVLTGLIAILIERTVYRPIRNSNRIVPMISALGAALILRMAAQIIWGPEMLVFPLISDSMPLKFGNLSINRQNLLGLGIASACVLSFTWILKRTRFGLATRAIVQNHDAASLMGIPLNRIISGIYFLGGFFGVIGGIILCSNYNMISIELGLWGTCKAWAAAQLGGVGSFYGVFLGGLLLGVAETMAATYISSGYKEAISYLIIVLVLLFKPDGLFGKKVLIKV